MVLRAHGALSKVLGAQLTVAAELSLIGSDGFEQALATVNLLCGSLRLHSIL